MWKLIDAGVAYFKNMKISVISNSLLNVISMLHCMKSWYCVRIDRGVIDRIDVLRDTNNCNFLEGSFFEMGRCKCSRYASSIATYFARNYVACVYDLEIDKSKNT